ncbi:MAG: hypothetical protein AAFO62_13005 [Pseudomonadota bacterium]
MANSAKIAAEPEVDGDKVIVLNVNHPGHTERADAAKYRDMRVALLRLLPTRAPGKTQKDIQATIKPLLPETTFPGGKASGWWAKTVQLDLEARGLVVRHDTKPLTWTRCR